MALNKHEFEYVCKLLGITNLSYKGNKFKNTTEAIRFLRPFAKVEQPKPIHAEWTYHFQENENGKQD